MASKDEGKWFSKYNRDGHEEKKEKKDYKRGMKEVTEGHPNEVFHFGTPKYKESSHLFI